MAWGLQAFRPFVDGAAERFVADGAAAGLSGYRYRTRGCAGVESASPATMGRSMDCGCVLPRIHRGVAALPRDFLYPFGMAFFFSASFDNYSPRRLIPDSGKKLGVTRKGLQEVKSPVCPENTANSSMTEIAYCGPRHG